MYFLSHILPGIEYIIHGFMEIILSRVKKSYTSLSSYK